MGKTTEKISEEMKGKLVSLYNEGKTDTEISKYLGVTKGAIFYWRKKLNLNSKFTYSKISKIDNEKFLELFNRGYTDKQIAQELNMSENGIYSHRKRHNYLRANYNIAKTIELSNFQKQVLIGTMLGDSSFKYGKDCINPGITCGHGPKQKEYCEHKTNIFKDLGAKCNYSKRNFPDKRTGKYYEVYTMRIPANAYLKSWYESFYKNNKKIIPFDLLNDNFTEVSLAFLFMDDGCKIGKSYSLATNCFSIEEITKFRIFLLEKFSLETTMFKSHVIRIRAKSAKHFTEIISPYIIESMQYKLIKQSL